MSNEGKIDVPAVPEQELSALLTTSLPYMTPVGRARLGQDIAQLYSSVSAPAQEFNKSVADAEIKAMYVESQGSDKGWLGIEGSYFIGGVVAARKQKAATAPAQERCSTCGYLTSEREHLGCLRRAVKDLDIATGGPYDAQGVGLTDEEIEAIAKKHMSTVGDHWSNEEAIRESHAEDFARDIISALRAKGGKHV